jgi:predicted phosphodiesterase
MTEFIFITANDIHISDDGPRGRIDDFKETVLGKLRQMCMACTKLGADGAIIAGDLYNLKHPAKNSHRLNQELIKVFREFPCPIYMIEGNHDLTANRLESLTDQPLGVLFSDNTLKQLRHEVIEKDGHKVSLVGVPFQEGLDLDTVVIPDRGGCVSQICAMHLYAGIKGGMLFKERLYGYDELSKFSPDIFVIGHYHLDQGVYSLDEKYFINIGSMSRGTTSEEDIAHHPQIGLIRITVDDSNPEKIEVIRKIQSIWLKIRPAHEVFDLVKKEEEKKESLEIQQFVEKLAAETVKSSTESAKDIDEIIDNMGLAKVIYDRVLGFIHEAKTRK